MTVRAQINPTLFDKLVSTTELSGLNKNESAGQPEFSVSSLRYYSVPRLDTFKEKSLELTVRREMAWILNTTNMESLIDLTSCPQVKSSVLNYGVADLAGKSSSTGTIRQRAREIEVALRAFEPRIDPKSLSVEIRGAEERENAVTYVIHANITAAVNALPVQLVTDIEADTGAVTIRD